MNMGLRQSIFIVLLLAVPLSSYFLVFKPQNAEIARAKTEIDLKRAMLDKLRVATSQTSDLERANTEIRASISAIEARLPTTKEVDTVLREVAQIASKCNLEMPVFKKGEKVVAAGMAQEQPLAVELTGDFDGFYRFLLELEKVARITRIPDLRLTRQEKGDGNMKATFTLSIYYQSEALASGESKGGGQ